jgi:hypothetical protein
MASVVVKIIILGAGIAFGAFLVRRETSTTNSSTRAERSHADSIPTQRRPENKRSFLSKVDEKVGRCIRKKTAKGISKMVSKVFRTQQENKVPIDHHKIEQTSKKKGSIFPKMKLKRL